ncbi:hypothetical protein MUP77_11200 [Candidatus Bathyarchaeota archaeon]|nr:hypothetical protein [Candidatus Bathyarchaeota archaeon]
MSEKALAERLDKITRQLDIITVVLLANSGLMRKDIAEAMGVSEKTIERLIPVSKIRGRRGKKPEAEQPAPTEAGENEQGQQQ